MEETLQHIGEPNQSLTSTLSTLTVLLVLDFSFMLLEMRAAGAFIRAPKYPPYLQSFQFI